MNNNEIWNFTTKERTLNSIYKRRLDIEQSDKKLRKHFGFGKEENRINETLIARILLSFFSYDIVNYINSMSHKLKTIAGLFKDLECKIHTPSIVMQAFIEIMDKIAQIDGILKDNKDFTSTIV